MSLEPIEVMQGYAFPLLLQRQFIPECIDSTLCEELHVPKANGGHAFTSEGIDS
jgi:hypothetical protein